MSTGQNKPPHISLQRTERCEVSIHLTEAVRPFPVPVVLRIRRRCDLDTGFEPGEPAGPVGERAESETGVVIDRASANRPVPTPRVENDGAVLQEQIKIRRVDVVDPRANLDPPEVRGRDRTELPGADAASGALLRHMERFVPLGGRRYRGGPGAQRKSQGDNRHEGEDEDWTQSLERHMSFPF